MKCVRCGTDSRYSERLDRRCKSCAEPFAFEPHGGDDRITDYRFDHALSAVSENGTIRWTFDHLYYEVCRRARRYLYFRATRRALVPFDRGSFDVMLEKWLAAHGSKALPPVPGQARPRIVVEPYAAWLEADIATYSFDRAVICDRGPAVDLLLANDFHVENRCAVLSVDGHPSSAFAAVLAMLKSNPSIDVIAVHDASPAGCDLPRRLAGEDQWFRSEILGGRARLVDAGLRPSQTKRLNGCFLENTQSVPKGVYAPKDAKWLQNFNCELAAVRPGRTLRYLRRLLRSETTGPTSGSPSTATTATATATMTSADRPGGRARPAGRIGGLAFLGGPQPEVVERFRRALGPGGRLLVAEAGSPGGEVVADWDACWDGDRAVLDLDAWKAVLESGRLAMAEGAFALAWTSEDGTLRLARDAVGERSLFVARCGRGVAFASALPPLLASGLVPRRLDPVGLASYLSYAYVPGARTLVEGVTELLPAELVEVRPGSVASTRFWSLPPERPTDGQTASEDERRALLRSALERAVDRRLPPPGEPVAATLSGGIDSSLVVALAGRRHDGPVHTLSLSFGRRYPNELRSARPWPGIAARPIRSSSCSPAMSSATSTTRSARWARPSATP